jgi:hypothetical protein
MSIGSCIVTPTPTAGPFTAAITGFRQSKIRKVSRPPPSRSTSPTRPDSRDGSCGPVRSKVSPPAARSAPAQKPRPAPVTITARTSSSASIASKAAIISTIIWPVKALSRSGRLSVIVAIPSSTS